MARSKSALMPVPAEPAPTTATPLLAKRHAGDVDRAEDSADGDGGGALDVVVEAAQLVPIMRQQPVGVANRKILPVQQYVRPARAHGIDERGNEVVVGGAAHAFVPPADVERVGQKLFVVGADVEEDRQRDRRMQAGAGGVERELADRDAHAAGALVAQPEDAFAVAHDDDVDAVKARVFEDAADAVLQGKAQEQPARLAEDEAELLTAKPYRRRIDNGHQLFDVPGQ
jgi:hypothetical protein